MNTSVEGVRQADPEIRGVWTDGGYPTIKEIFPANLQAWKIEEKEARCLAASLPDGRMALRCYALRM
jgi:hypothetical protein